MDWHARAKLWGRDYVGFYMDHNPKDAMHFKAQDDVSEIFQDKCPFGKISKNWQSFFCLSIMYTVPVYLNRLDFFICMTLTINPYRKNHFSVHH